MPKNLATGELVSFAVSGGGMRRGLLVRLDGSDATIQTIDGERMVIDADLIRGRGGAAGKGKRVSVRAVPRAVPEVVESVVELDEDVPSRRAFRPQPKPLPPSRSRRYLDYVRGLPCCSCGHPSPSDPHHFGPRGLGQKTDDTRTVPLCRACHDTFHRGGSLPGQDKLSTRLYILQKQVDLLVQFVRREP